ncbi:MAG: sigma 54-interacting transcriptional regulator, partial [Psychrilyobacter sp.]|uniref:sigma-54-dependent transcriptional regulator n=1 Tax=Psychrilyobacter sp. TaxID=2586924 RepID=UPI003C78094D
MKKSILAISERKEILKQVRKELLGEYEVITFNNFLDGLDMLRESDFDIILLDQNMTWFTFTEVRRKLNGIGKDFVVVGLIEEETEEVLKDLRGADIYNYLLKPLCIKEFNKLIFPALQSLSILKEKRKLEKKLSDTEEIQEIVGQSTKIKEIKNLIDKIAESDLTVLVSGENGVGKELIAAEIYKKSDRRKKNFMVISCASMSSDIIESELFGYERDVFPGSGSGKIGILEEADGGTVFLDEITGLDIKAQAKLLRVIEYGEFRRVGGNKTKKVDIRFIVSTNKNLKTEVESGKFRSDLYHRLTA